MNKKSIDSRLRNGVNLPSMEELENDFAKNFRKGLVLLVVFILSIAIATLKS